MPAAVAEWQFCKGPGDDGFCASDPACRPLGFAQITPMTRREKLEAMLADAPEDVFLQYALAMEFASANEPVQATARLEGLLAADPHYVPAWYQLGRLLEQTGQRDRGRQALVRGIEVARRAGDDHAEAEMRALLDELGPAQLQQPQA